jgi:hypothetical protein
MTHPPTISLPDKRALAQSVGRDLVERYGKKKYYSAGMVRSSARRVGLRHDWDCWALAMYASAVEFNDHHRTLGHACDYIAMRREMIVALSKDAAATWDDLDLAASWLDWGFDFDFFT